MLLGSARQSGAAIRDAVFSVMHRVHEQFVKSKDVLWQRSRARWRQAQPTPDLTWGTELNGDSFIDKAILWEAFSSDRTILEIGPGYGRLLKSCLHRGVPFRLYQAVDISSANVQWLRGKFRDPRVSFLLGDAESITLDSRFDVMFSSLTFKHLYPTFEVALTNIVKYANAGAMFLIDLREGTTRLFEADRVTYIRCYTRSEIRAILDRVGLDIVAFDYVIHDPAHRRLLVVAKYA
jgi:hypothetical protein